MRFGLRDHSPRVSREERSSEGSALALELHDSSWLTANRYLSPGIGTIQATACGRANDYSRRSPRCAPKTAFSRLPPVHRLILKVAFGSTSPVCRAVCERPVFAHSGRSRRKPAVADRGLGRLNWADCGPTRVASGRTRVRAGAVIPLQARNGFHRPKRFSKIRVVTEPSRRGTAKATWDREVCAGPLDKVASNVLYSSGGGRGPS